MWPDLIPDPPQVNVPPWLYVVVYSAFIIAIFIGLLDWSRAFRNRK